MAQVKKLEGACKEFFDFGFADLMRREERMQIEIREASIRDAGGKKLAQAAGFDRAKRADFFEDDTMQRVLKNKRVELAANLGARASLDEDGAKKPQSIALQTCPTILCLRNHRIRGPFFHVASRAQQEPESVTLIKMVATDMRLR